MLILTLVSSAMAAENVQVKVKGMVCSFRAQGLTKKFKAEPAVETVKVTLSDKLIRLTLKDKQTMADEKIKKIIEEAGYDVQSIERN
jgi:mercuric ion binding protein